MKKAFSFANVFQGRFTEDTGVYIYKYYFREFHLIRVCINKLLKGEMVIQYIYSVQAFYISVSVYAFHKVTGTSYMTDHI